MKHRTGFVSNSSSSSFIVSKHKIPKDVRDRIDNMEAEVALLPHDEEDEHSGTYSKRFDFINDWRGWRLMWTKDFLTGATTMTNFNMLEMLVHLGVKEEDIVEFTGYSAASGELEAVLLSPEESPDVVQRAIWMVLLNRRTIKNFDKDMVHNGTRKEWLASLTQGCREEVLRLKEEFPTLFGDLGEES